MALDGTITTTESYGRSVTLYWHAKQSTENNRSWIYWELYGSGSTSSYVVVREVKVTITVGSTSTTLYYRSSSADKIYCYPNTLIATSDSTGATGITIYHNSDGTPPKVTITVQAGIYEWSINNSGTSTIKLNSIARASVPTCITKGLINTQNVGDIGSTIRIYTNRVSSSFKHKLYYNIGGSGNTLIGENVSDYVDWMIPSIICYYLMSYTVGTGVITCETYYGNTLIGSKTCKFTCSVPSDIEVKDCTVSIGTDTYVAKYGGHIQGVSKIPIELSPTVSQNEYLVDLVEIDDPSGYSTKIDGLTYTGKSITYTPNTVVNNVTVTSTTITDKRGRSKEFTFNKQSGYSVIAYDRPNISSVKVTRVDAPSSSSQSTIANLKENMSGSSCRLTVVYSISSLNSKNSKTLLVYSGSTLLSRVSLTDYSATYYVLLKDIGTNAVNLTLKLLDDFNTATYQTNVSLAFSLMHLANTGKSIAFGMLSTATESIDNLFEVGQEATFYDDVNIKGSTVCNSDATFHNDVNIYKDGSAIRLQDVIYPSNHVYTELISEMSQDSKLELGSKTWTDIDTAESIQLTPGIYLIEQSVYSIYGGTSGSGYVLIKAMNGSNEMIGHRQSAPTYVGIYSALSNVFVYSVDTIGTYSITFQAYAYPGGQVIYGLKQSIWRLP